MKKLLLALAIGTASLVSFSSCTKETNNYTNGYSYVYTVESSQWKAIPEANRPTYEVVIDVPDLDKQYFEDGEVSVAALFAGNPDFYEIIPGSIGDYHFSANYGIGSVAVYAEYRGPGSAVKPEKMLVKIVLTDALPGN
ncbi:hypothetical protein GCM10022216_33660 [Sphingobacterium kyonggiense]|uniref:Gliding motility-associated lipoprotein GldH n=1 Tax=Sphingobacterium kyonggiense TaxID=714075 RepID=A0ABP7Z592_9SPHI